MFKTSFRSSDLLGDYKLDFDISLDFYSSRYDINFSQFYDFPSFCEAFLLLKNFLKSIIFELNKLVEAILSGDIFKFLSWGFYFGDTFADIR